MDIKTHPRQRTDYVVRAGASERSRTVYRGNDAVAAHYVARAHRSATVTFRTAEAASAYTEQHL